MTTSSSFPFRAALTRVFLRTSLFAALAVTLGASVATAALDPKYDPTKVPIPTLHPIKQWTPERFQLGNGMVVYLQEDHDLPIVTATLYCRASAAWAPAGKTGLGGLTGEVMRSGGTAKHSGDWLDDHLAAIGAEISTSISNDFASGTFHCLKENTAEVVDLFADVLTAPAFPDEKIELGKIGMRRGIAQRNDDLTTVLQRVARQSVFGKDHPYARLTEYATVDAITRDDLRKFHDLCFTPDRAYCVVFGDFKAAEMKKLITAKLGGWKKTGIPMPAMPPDPPLGTPRLVFAPKNDVTQSGAVLAHLGFLASDPDYPAMDVYENLLGGGFQSRLFNKIRTERGLAYSAGAVSGSNYTRPGVFNAFTLTRSESTMVALGLLRAEVERSLKEPLGEDEVKRAKESVLNSLVFAYSEPSAAAGRAAYYEAIGYPKDFLQRYQKGVEATTPASVQEAARRKVHPDHFVTIVVGKESDFDRPLTSLGLPVERVDLTIPAPGSKSAAATESASPAALEKGKALLAKATDLAGGAAAWSGIKTWKSSNSLQVTMQGQSVQVDQTLTWQLPDHRVAVQKLPFGEMSMGFDGKNGWRKAMGQIQDDPTAARQASDQYAHSLFRLFSSAGKLEVQALTEPKTIDGVAYTVAAVKTPDVQDWTLYFAPDGRLARMEYQSTGQQGPEQVAEAYADWKPVGPIQYPHAVTLYRNGEKFASGTLASAEVNAAVDASAFAKPAN